MACNLDPVIQLGLEWVKLILFTRITTMQMMGPNELNVSA